MIPGLYLPGIKINRGEMILTITTTYKPATDLGFLLHKHPAKLQSVDLSVGQAHIFYPERSETKTTVCLLLDIDPLTLVRKSRDNAGDGFVLGHYVNDRPYVSSSFMSVAIAKAFSTAMNGKCKEKPELVDLRMPFEISLASLPVPSGGEKLIRKFFEPLGYEIELNRINLDEKFPAWGESRYFSLKMRNKVTLRDLLTHLYVIIPALDYHKHYFISGDEVDKLLGKGERWLKDHPAREEIIRRYLINISSLSKNALKRISDDNEIEIDDADEKGEEKIRKENLHAKRLKIVLRELIRTGAETVVDMGCGEGKLLSLLLKEKQFDRIVGVDVSYRSLILAKQRLKWDDMSPRQKEKIELIQGALTYRDSRLKNFDAAAVIEVIEHLDPERLKSFERTLFEFARPAHVVITTPNSEYNVRYNNIGENQLRHEDHRFEWNRELFRGWVEKTAKRYGYKYRIENIGDVDPEAGAPTQMAVLSYGN